jgi:hypothetical protein
VAIGVCGEGIQGDGVLPAAREGSVGEAAVLDCFVCEVFTVDFGFQGRVTQRRWMGSRRRHCCKDGMIIRIG